ncbi:MAG: amidohydrolase family protein [Actinomycetota bacterium]
MVYVIDAHLHVVDRHAVDPALVKSNASLAPSGPWWESVDAGTDAVLSRVHDAGLERAVVVQAIAAHGYDCSVLLGAARPGVALVGAVDPFGPDPIGTLEALAAAGIAGLRFFSIRSPRPWLTTEVGRSLVARCVELGLRPSVCVLPTEIPEVVALASAFPDTEFAVDHVAFAATDEQVDMLVKQENLCPTVTPTSAIDVATAVARFGRDRLSWGSDYPQHGAHYPVPVDLAASSRLWF